MAARPHIWPAAAHMVAAVDRTSAARRISPWQARMAAVDRTVAAGHPVAADLTEAAGLTEAARAAIITGKRRPADTRVPAPGRRKRSVLASLPTPLFGRLRPPHPQLLDGEFRDPEFVHLAAA